MAIPWQSDFFACADYWWPTARPDDVFESILKYPEKSVEWARDVNSDDIVDKWNKLGFVKPIEKDNTTFFLEKERKYKITSQHPSQHEYSFFYVKKDGYTANVFYITYHSL